MIDETELPSRERKWSFKKNRFYSFNDVFIGQVGAKQIHMEIFHRFKRMIQLETWFGGHKTNLLSSSHDTVLWGSLHRQPPAYCHQRMHRLVRNRIGQSVAEVCTDGNGAGALFKFFFQIFPVTFSVHPSPVALSNPSCRQYIFLHSDANLSQSKRCMLRKTRRIVFCSYFINF